MDELRLPALEGRYGDHPDAVRVGDAAISWEALRDKADALARRIAGATGLAVHATPSLDTVTAVVAGLRAGVPVVPVPADVGDAERAHILADSGASLWADGALTELPTHNTRPDAALVLYTSGTTGPPKGVLLGAEALAYDLDALARAWQWTPDDTLVHGLPLYHVHGLVLGVLGALRIGSRLVHTGRPTTAAYAAANGSLYFGVPTVWSRICADPAAAAALRPARLLVSGSAALPAAVFEAMSVQCGHTPVERYGMTETLITVSARADGPRRAGAVGTPLPGIQTRLGADGELFVRGPTLLRGYRNQPPATGPDGWFATGDIAEIEPDGTHRIVGRASVDLIKSGGYRVGAGEVEEALLAHPGVREAAVVGAPHPDLGQEIVAYVVADGVSEATLIEFVAARLARHKRPRRVHLRDALPRNALGKVRKQLL
ncbi:MAG: acyl-CoA synthetase [Actinobacteria bacterium]|nr:MAG: acyl-CoA synthetase [Actinomycetota bacterium]